MTDTRRLIDQLAARAALSRSAYFERFSRALGVAPMAYLLAWRMALARELLREGRASVAEAAQHVGYRSVSTFSMAFHRHTGLPPRAGVKAAKTAKPR